MSIVGQKIIELHGAGTLKKSALSIRDGGGVFEHFLRTRKYKTALEIGTYKGVSAAEMAQYCDHVHTIDLKRGKLERMGHEFDRYALWASLGVGNISLHLVDDDDDKARLIDGLEFDFAFIDGSHDDPVSIRRDFEAVKRCGAVLFHDIDRRERPEQNMVIDFFESLPKHQTQVMDIFGFWSDRG